MYVFILSLHNILRWVAVLAGLAAAVVAISGWLGRREWSPANRMTGLLFGISVDIQLLIGLILYFFLSPLTRPMFTGNAGTVMGNSEMRFFAVEHIFIMIVVVALVHMGTALARKADDATAKHRRAAIWYTLTFLLLLAGIPWWRPLLRFFS